VYRFRAIHFPQSAVMHPDVYRQWTPESDDWFGFMDTLYACILRRSGFRFVLNCSWLLTG
jgi:hypothetical protein